MPVVSIVLPTYNRLALLREAVDSVRVQTFGDWELIVVDDGSDDGTAEYLDALAAMDPRIVVVRLPHTANLPRIRNAAIARARGEWVAFLDSDDAWRADKLQAHLDAHRANPSARWSYSGRSMMDATGETLPDARFAAWRPHSGHIARLLLTHEAMVAFPSVMVERALLAEVGGMDEALVFATDYDLELRLAARAECICIPEPVVRVRVHAGSTTRRRVEVNESFIRVYARFAAADGSPEVRRICRRQQAFYARWVARYRMASREPIPTLRAVLFSLRMDPVATVRWLGSVVGGRLGRRGSSTPGG
ncbi:MAG TPA: glycosyltransferase [Longimicrobium sp.]|nr:glycosyltransferase [Longimicrobium sp.]